MATLIEIIARITRRPVEGITPALCLKELGLSASIGLTILHSALERQLGQPFPPLQWQMTVADLLQLQASTPARAAAPKPAAPERPLTGATSVLDALVTVGVDIEEVAKLPPAVNLEGHDYYVSTFTPQELQAARDRPDPRIHLCGIFCAKEALRKAAPELAALRFSDITLHHDIDGRPRIAVDQPALESRFSFQVSISHTDAYAVAVVLSLRKSF